MLELAIGISSVIITAMGVSFFWHKALQREQQMNEFLTQTFNALSKMREDGAARTLDFIEKNIPERVIYTTAEEGYSNVHKHESQEESKIPDDGAEELTAEDLIEDHKPSEGE